MQLGFGRDLVVTGSSDNAHSTACVAALSWEQVFPEFEENPSVQVAALAVLATMRVLEGAKPSCKEQEASFKCFRNQGE